MNKLWFRRALAVAGFIGASAGVLSAYTYKTALPGTVNYVEGQASISGRALDVRQNGNTVVQPNQMLSTGNGKAEMLLSPGVLVRTGDHTDVRMVSTGLVDPTIEVVHGSAMVEVDQKLKDARVSVLENGATATLLKQGLYRFDSDQGRAQVLDGKMAVAANGESKELGKGKEVALNGEPLKAVKFDRKAQQDDLYKWSKVRSDYLAQANASTAQYIYAGSGPFWGSGWYWNPYFTSWSWLPGDGLFYSPFGYAFYSPSYFAYAPYSFGYGYGGGYARGFRGGIGRTAGVGSPGIGVLRQRAINAGGFHGSAGFSGLRGGGRH